jgi:hypothetical protein
MARRGGTGDEMTGGGLCAFKAIGSLGRGWGGYTYFGRGGARWCLVPVEVGAGGACRWHEAGRVVVVVTFGA